MYAFYPYTSSGNSRVAYEISKGLVRRGHDVTVLTTNLLEAETMFAPRKNEYNINGIKVRYNSNLFYKPHGVIPMLYSPGVINHIRKSLMDYDIVHLHENRFYTSIFLHHYAKKYGVPYVLQAHGSVSAKQSKEHIKMLYDFLFGSRTLRDASKVIALNQVEANQFKNAGVPDSNIAIIPNGIDLAMYENLPPAGSFKKKFDLDEREKVVLYLGRIHRMKGIGFLVRSFAYLAKINGENLKLVIAGPDSGYLNKVHSLVNTLGISDSVLFADTLSEENKISAFVDADIVVNVEPENVFGLVPLEAAACSKPVIVSNGNAISEAVHKGKFGFSVKYGDIDELVEIMRKMLNNDELLSEMGQKGREFVFENCDWANIITKLESVYEEVAGTK